MAFGSGLCFAGSRTPPMHGVTSEDASLASGVQNAVQQVARGLDRGHRAGLADRCGCHGRRRRGRVGDPGTSSSRRPGRRAIGPGGHRLREPPARTAVQGLLSANARTAFAGLSVCGSPEFPEAQPATLVAEVSHTSASKGTFCTRQSVITSATVSPGFGICATRNGNSKTASKDLEKADTPDHQEQLKAAIHGHVTSQDSSSRSCVSSSPTSAFLTPSESIAPSMGDRRPRSSTFGGGRPVR